MDTVRKEQYDKFLEEKDALIESLTKDFAEAFKKHGPESVFYVFTRAGSELDQSYLNELDDTL